MFNMKKSLIALSIGAASVLPVTSYAVTYNLGNVTDIASPVGGAFSTTVFAGFVLDGGETYNFSLDSTGPTNLSNLTINMSQFLGVNIGNTYFSLKQGATEIAQIALAPLIVLSSNTYTYNNLLDGNYSLTLVPSNILAVNLGGQLTLSAASVTAVPEPETNALMMLGLGMIGLIARRKLG